MKELDLNSWSRRSHYELFSSYLQPCFRLDVRLDVTALEKGRKRYGGLFLPFVYLLMRAVNRTPGARLRCLDGKVVDVEVSHPSFTVDLHDGNFAFCCCAYREDYPTFRREAEREIARVKAEAEKGGKEPFTTNDRADAVYLSCLPWIDFVSISNPLPYGNAFSMSIPRLNWGRFTPEGDRVMVTLSATLNHALIDGREASEMLCGLQEDLLNADALLEEATL